MLPVEAAVEEAVIRVQSHAVSKGVAKSQARHLARTSMLRVCTDVAASVANDDNPISRKNRRRILRGAQTHLHNAERKIHYWLKKRKLTVQEMNRRLMRFNSSRCPKIFWDPITREQKEERSK